jgi:hypothetical protein
LDALRQEEWLGWKTDPNRALKFPRQLSKPLSRAYKNPAWFLSSFFLGALALKACGYSPEG